MNLDRIEKASCLLPASVTSVHFLQQSPAYLRPQGQQRLLGGRGERALLQVVTAAVLANSRACSWVWASAGTPVAAAHTHGAFRQAVSTRCKSAGSSVKQPPSARVSPTPRPLPIQVTTLDAVWTAAAAACCTSDRPSPPSRLEIWATQLTDLTLRRQLQGLHLLPHRCHRRGPRGSRFRRRRRNRRRRARRRRARLHHSRSRYPTACYSRVCLTAPFPEACPRASSFMHLATFLATF